MKAEWKEAKTPCDSPALVVPIDAAPGTKLRYKQIEKELDGRGRIRLLLSLDKIGNDKELAIELDKDGKKRTLKVAVPSRKRRDLAPPTYAILGERKDWSGRAQVVLGGKELFAYDLSADAATDGTMRLYLPCGVAGADERVGKLLLEFNGAVIVADRTSALLERTDLPTEVDDAFTVAIEDDRGTTGEVRMTGKLRPGPLLQAMYANLAEAPIASAPARQDGAANPTLAFFDGVADTTHLNGKRVRDASQVAITTIQRWKADPCTYSGKNIAYSSVDRVSKDATITLYEARTGTKLADKTFSGKPPKCPRTITVSTMDGVEIDKDVAPVLEGEARLDAARAWLTKKLK